MHYSNICSCNSCGHNWKEQKFFKNSFYGIDLTDWRWKLLAKKYKKNIKRFSGPYEKDEPYGDC